VITLYAKGQDVQVVDGPPVSPPVSSGSGVVTLYAKGQQVEVIDLAQPTFTLHTRQLNLSKMVQFYDWSAAGRYSRFIRNMRWSNTNPAANDIQITANDRTDSDYRLSGTYTLKVQINGEGEWVALATMAVAPGTVRKTFENVNMSAIPNGWHLFDIGLPTPSDGAVAVPYWMHVGAPTEQTWAPTQTGSYGIGREEGSVAKWGKAPVQLSGAGYPLKPRQFVPMTGHPARSTLYKRDIAPSINGDPPYLRTIEGGVKTCLNSHAYAWSSFIAKLPGVVLRDGPRGRGLVSGLTHIEIGRRGGIYALDCWRMVHVDTKGYVKTLLGWRHGENGLELVGDWSAIPAERHGLHEAWGFAWDKRTTAESALDTSILLDRGDGVMEHPHTVGPVVFIADSQNNRVLRAQFDPRDHTALPKVTEFISGLNDPWDVVYIGNGQIAVSERFAHRINVYDADSGAFVETLVQGVALSGTNKNRLVEVYGTLEQRRAATTVGPEGLFYLNGWLYFGSRAAQRVKRISLASRVIETVCDPYFDTSPGGSQFCKIAVRADGTVFASTWESGAKGGPRAYKPDGTVWSLQETGSSSLTEGRGGKWADVGYSTASAADDNRIVYSGADYGLAELSLALPSDPPLWDQTLVAAGKAEYERAGGRLTHGVGAFSDFGYPPPWGESVAMDYYFRAQGHVE
jgi:hypothetical protein